MKQHPEQKARNQIDKLLQASGWIVQSSEQLNLSSGAGVALREYLINIDPAHMVNARNVHQAFYRPYAGHHDLHSGLLRHIAFVHFGIAPASPDGRGCIGALRLAQLHYLHPGALPGKQLCDGPPNATAPAGNHRCFIGK